jgi:predicted Ser/Thr protein kinase
MIEPNRRTQPPDPAASVVRSEDQWLEWERAAEELDAMQSTESHGRYVDIDAEAGNHRRYYELIDAWASPVRAALTHGQSPEELEEEPPVLAEYEKLELIGRGGMGVVYRGVHRKTRRTDAVKVLRPDGRVKPHAGHAMGLQSRLWREAQLAASVSHEHIVPIYQVGEVDGCDWFSMQYVQGRSLRDATMDSPIPTETLVELMAQVARAIDAVHRHGILHGDIKPHNIMIEAESERPLITDFGLADWIESQRVALGVAGTPVYMAPEIAKAALQPSAPEEIASVRTVACDIYSLGATLWFGLTGEPPCEARETVEDQLEAVAAGQLRIWAGQHARVPRGLLEICRRCMEHEPASRYSTAGAVADALVSWSSRPQWNGYFPGLRWMLLWVVAPVLGIGGVCISWMLLANVFEGWVWAVLLGGYIPLFLAFAFSQHDAANAVRARRELWSVWIGHFMGSVVCLIGFRVLCHPDSKLAMTFFYPACAALSCVVFFAKSGNFWVTYRWIGVVWAGVAILMSIAPSWSPILFGAVAALSSVVTALGDDAFMKEQR